MKNKMKNTSSSIFVPVKKPNKNNKKSVLKYNEDIFRNLQQIM
jgi:hypothetical protein